MDKDEADFRLAMGVVLWMTAKTGETLGGGGFFKGPGAGFRLRDVRGECNCENYGYDEQGKDRTENRDVKRHGGRDAIGMWMDRGRSLEDGRPNGSSCN